MLHFQINNVIIAPALPSSTSSSSSPLPSFFSSSLAARAAQSAAALIVVVVAAAAVVYAGLYMDYKWAGKSAALAEFVYRATTIYLACINLRELPGYIRW